MSLSETAVQQEEGLSGPSPEKVDYFFAGAGRGEILDDILKNLAHDATILIITGDQGSGKTTLCRMAEQRLAAGHIPIFFPATLESFEEVIRLIGHRMGIETSDLTKGKVADLLVEIRRLLQEDHSKLVLFFDQAERIFLATLERIRKMLDFLNEQGDTAQLVFAGQEILLSNLRQLRIVSFREAVEKEYVLGPLSLADTTAFLRGAFAHDSAKEVGASVAKDVAVGVHASAGGNLAKTAALAHSARQNASQDASFWVLLENIEAKEKPQRLASFKKSLPRLPQWSWRMPSPAQAIGRWQKRLSLAWLTKLSRPKIVLPRFTLPKITLPSLTLPKVSLPKIVLPKIVLPKLSLPKFELPKISLPDGRAVWQKSAFRRWLTALPWPSPRQWGMAVALVLGCLLAIVVWPEKKIDQPTVSDPDMASVVADVGEPPENTSVAPATGSSPDGEADGGAVTGEPPPPAAADGATEEPPSDVLPTVQAPNDSPPTVTATPSNEKPQTPEAQPEQTASGQVPVVDQLPATKPAAAPVVADASPLKVDSDSAGQVQDDRAVKADESKQVVTEDQQLSPEVLAIAESVRRQEDQLDSDRNEPVKPTPPKATDIPETKGVSPAAASSAPDRSPVPVEIKVVNINATKHKKIVPIREPEPAAKVETAVVEKSPPVVKIVADVPKVQPVQEGSADNLYKKRLAAGERWKKRSDNSRYTVQILTLNSADAEKKLKEMLAQDGYKEHADKLTIVRKDDSAGTIAVFYGDYDSMTNARNARNTIPSSLRKHNPYAISVDGALRKIGVR